jgi:hypothetical protein
VITTRGQQGYEENIHVHQLKMLANEGLNITIKCMKVVNFQEKRECFLKASPQ